MIALTYEETIAGLRHCSEEDECTGCPLDVKDPDSSFCQSVLMQRAALYLEAQKELKKHD